MGRKKRKDTKPYCWYCGPDKTYDDENTLIQHQKNKHFKCQTCYKKLTTATALKTHALFVHKEDLTKVPNAKEGRDGFDFDVIGTQGIFEADSFMSEGKKQKTDGAAGAPAPPPSVPGIPPQGFRPPFAQNPGFPSFNPQAPRPPIPGMPPGLPYGQYRPPMQYQPPPQQQQPPPPQQPPPQHQGGWQHQQQPPQGQHDQGGWQHQQQPQQVGNQPHSGQFAPAGGPPPPSGQYPGGGMRPPPQHLQPQQQFVPQMMRPPQQQQQQFSHPFQQQQNGGYNGPQPPQHEYPPQQQQQQPHQPPPPAPAPAPAAPAQGLKVVLVYHDQSESMEEKRAALPQYQINQDASRLKAQLSNIESRLSSFVR